MPFLESLFLYNTLETLIIILFCNVLSDIKFVAADIKHCFVLGSINLFFQYINLLIPNVIFQLILNFGMALFILPLINYLYFYKLKHYKICYLFYSYIFLLPTNCFMTFLFNNIVGKIFENIFIDKYYEFMFNILLRVVQLLLIYILYKGKCFIMKKLLKKIATVSVEQAFTIMNQYQPKVPEKLAKEIAEKQ